MYICTVGQRSYHTVHSFTCSSIIIPKTMYIDMRHINYAFTDVLHIHYIILGIIMELQVKLCTVCILFGPTVCIYAGCSFYLETRK